MKHLNFNNLNHYTFLLFTILLFYNNIKIPNVDSINAKGNSNSILKTVTSSCLQETLKHFLMYSYVTVDNIIS